MKLSKEDASILLTFLQRVQLQGNEAETHVIMQQKLKLIINETEDKPKKGK